MQNRLLRDNIPAAGLLAGPPLVAFPFIAYPTPDPYARLTERRRRHPRDTYTPTLAARTSYTNLLLYSRLITHATWTATRATAAAAAAAQALSPLGEVAYKIAEDSSNNTHYLRQSLSLASGIYTLSIIARPAERSKIEVVIQGSGAYAQGFDLAAGTVFSNTLSLGAFTAAGTIPLADGWWWCWCTVPTTTISTVEIYLNDGSTASYMGNGSAGVYFSDAQLLAGTAYGPYIPTTTAARTISAPDLDDPTAPAYDPLAYLAAETDPTPLGLTDLVETRRTYARIPGTQVVPTSQAFSKPSVSDSAGFSRGSRRLVLQSPSVLSLPANDQGNIAVSSANGVAQTPENELFSAKAVTGFQLSVASGGTFTITYGANTTGALNWNDSNVTIKAAIEALPSVTFTVDVNNTLAVFGVLNISGNATAAFTMTSSLTTNAGTAQIFNVYGFVNNQNLTIPNWLISPGHGIISSDDLFFSFTSEVNGIYQAVSIPTGGFLALDANTLAVPDFYLFFGAFAYVALIADYVGKKLRNWSPGADVVRARKTERYYLPGVTADVDEAVDIPIATPITNEGDLFGAILAGNTWATYDTQGPEQWRGPILRTVETEINLTDL